MKTLNVLNFCKFEENYVKIYTEIQKLDEDISYNCIPNLK
jgi:hypothetical protein